MLNRSWPFFTKSPSLKFTATSWPEICALMVTLEMASTLPIASNSTGMVRETTSAAVTGAPIGCGRAACTSPPLLQPASRASRSSARIESLTPSVFMFEFFPIAKVVTICAVETPARCPSLHAGEPDFRQCVRDLLRVKLPVLLSAEKLLDQDVIGHHPQKPPGSKQGIGLAKRSLADPRANIPGQHLVVPGDKLVEESRRELMVFERREPEQAG